MQVLLFTDADVFAGTERHIFDLAEALRSDFPDLETRVACPRPSPLAARCEDAGIAVMGIPKRGLVDWNAVRVLRRALKSGNLDIVHAHNGRTALAAALAVTFARRGAFVMTQHFLAPNHTSQSGIQGALSGLAHRFVVRRAHRLIAISHAVGNAMRARHSEDGEKIRVVLNGVPDCAHRVLDSPNQVREKFGIGNRPLLICASRLETEKGFAVLIEAMAAVCRAQPDVLCLIAGEGQLRDALQAQIERENLEENVRLVGFQDDIASLMNAADVFVLPSLNEPFGLSLIEAMALGKPVVATRAGGPLEIVEENVSGYLIAPASPHELAVAVIGLLCDANKREKMGKAARARYESCFTANRMAREIVAVYEDATCPAH